MSVPYLPSKLPVSTSISLFVTQSAHLVVTNFVPSDSPTQRPFVWLPLPDTSNFMTSVLPSPLKSPASTSISLFVTQSAHLVVTNFMPSDSPTQRPFVWLPLPDTSNFMTSVLPSPLKSPASTSISLFVTQSAHLVVTNFMPSDSPTQRP